MSPNAKSKSFYFKAMKALGADRGRCSHPTQVLSRRGVGTAKSQKPMSRAEFSLLCHLGELEDTLDFMHKSRTKHLARVEYIKC